MSEHDMIRRGDALEVFRDGVNDERSDREIEDAIAAIPAATPPDVTALVKALRWIQRHPRSHHERRAQVVDDALAKWGAAQE